MACLPPWVLVVMMLNQDHGSVPPWWGDMARAALALPVPVAALGWGAQKSAHRLLILGTRSCQGFKDWFEPWQCASAWAFPTVLWGLGGFKCLGGKFEHCNINKVCNKNNSLSLPCTCPPSHLSKPNGNTAAAGLGKTHGVRVMFGKELVYVTRWVPKDRAGFWHSARTIPISQLFHQKCQWAWSISWFIPVGWMRIKGSSSDLRFGALRLLKKIYDWGSDL